MKEILITSSVLILAIILLRFLFRNKVSRRLIYGAWLLVALRLLIPVQFGNLNFSVLTPAKPVTNIITDIAQRPVSGPDREQVYSSVLQDYLSQGSPVFIPEVQEQVESQIQHGRPEQEVYDELLESNKPESILLPEISQEIETKVSQTAVPTVGQIALAIWVVGMAVMAGWFAYVNLTFRRKLRASAKAFDLPESKVPVKVSPVLTSPCLFGLWKPTVYMTPGCVDNAQTRHHVLTHELTHLHHRDHIWSWVRCLCLCIYWFNPLVWVAASLSRRDCELACDEAALKKLGEGERLAYGKTLLDMVSSVPAPGQLLETATAMHETKKQLKERMKCIVKKPKVFLTAAIILLVVLTVITGCTFSGAGNGSTGSNPISTQPTTTQTQTTAPTTITTQPTEPPIPTPAEVIDGTYSVIADEQSSLYSDEDVEDFYYFNHHKLSIKDASVKILHTSADGKEDSTFLAYDAEKKNFIYTVNGVGHTYDNLIYTPVAGQPEDDFDYLHILLVSDDPDATYLDTLDKENPTAVIVYARFVTLEKSLEGYGDIPTIVKQDGIETRELGHMIYLKDSYFMIDLFTDSHPKTTNEFTTVYRFDYDGNLLCTVEFSGYYSQIDCVELTDGGFLISYRLSKQYNLARYDADGKQLWAHNFPTTALVDFHVVNDEIICFGRPIEDTVSGNITATTISLDGEILSEKTILNGTYSFLYVILEEDGFKIYAYNGYKTGTGDVPYDRFCVWFDLELDVVKYEEDNSFYTQSPEGYLNGKPIFFDDPIFNYHPSETFPENANDFGNDNVIGAHCIFAYQDGYVIVRTHYMDTCFFSHASNFPFYYENIFTYYDSNGVPQWQYVTPIYLA